MLVKNISGVTQNYEFASLTLTSGQTKEIDDSYVENPEFQIAVESQTIAVVNYEVDQRSVITTVKVSKSPNEPSNSQKGAMVTSSSPSPLNPFLTRRDSYLADYSVKFSSVSEIDVVVNRLTVGDDVLKDIEDSFDLTSDLFITGVGGNSGVPVEADTLYYLYIHKTEFTLASSKTAPESMTATDWVNLGKFQTNEDSELTNELFVLGNTDKITTTQLLGLTGSQEGIGSSWANITESRIKFLSDEKSVILAFVVFSLESTVNETLLYAFQATGSTPTKEDWSVYSSQINNPYYANIVKKITGEGLLDFSAKMKGGSTNHSCDLTTVAIVLQRIR